MVVVRRVETITCTSKRKRRYRRRWKSPEGSKTLMKMVCVCVCVGHGSAIEATFANADERCVFCELSRTKVARELVAS